MTVNYRVRKQIVDYFAQRKSSQEIASMLNVSLDQIQDWRRRYKHGHEDWVFRDHQKFSIQERKEIFGDFFSQQKYGIKAYAARPNLSYNTFNLNSPVPVRRNGESTLGRAISAPILAML